MTESQDDLKSEIERLNRELAAAQQERSQSAAYGIELLNKNENLQQKYEAIETSYEQSKRDLQELREAWNKAVNEQRISATTVFEKEVQLLNDSDALQASFTHAKQEIEKELKQTKLQLDSAIADKDRYQLERDELSKKVASLEQERKNLKIELKDLKSRESKLLNENSELEEENVSLQKQVSNLRSNQVEFESSKHEIQRLQDELTALNLQLEEVVTLRRITERQMQEALEALESEREQKYALRKELDKRNSADPIINWTSLAALKGSPHLANLALRNFNSTPRDGSSINRENEDGSPTNGFSDQDIDPSYDIINELDMPSIEGSLFDEVHLNEIKKLQQNLEDKENQRSNLNTKLIEIQHKLESKIRQSEEFEKRLQTICKLVEDTYNEKQQVTPSTISNILDDFDNVYSHLEHLFSLFKVQQHTAENNKKESAIVIDANINDQVLPDGEKKIENSEILHSDDIQTLRTMLYRKHEQLKQLRTILKSNKESAEVALANLKSKYDIEKAIVVETMTKLRLEHKRLNEDAATFASLRSHFSARIEEYNTEIEKLQSKLSASEQEKNTLNSILRMAIEQKIMLTQKLEALEMDREDPQNGKNGNGQQPRSGAMRSRGSSNRAVRQPRSNRLSGGDRK